VRELKSRIQAVLRRSMPDEQPIQYGDLYLDPVSQRVKVRDEDGNPRIVGVETRSRWV